jgi:hypothetical protein
MFHPNVKLNVQNNPKTLKTIYVFFFSEGNIFSNLIISSKLRKRLALEQLKKKTSIEESSIEAIKCKK